MGDSEPLALLAASLLVWAVTILVILAGCARFSGWLSLSRAYPCPGGCPPERSWLNSLVFRGWFGYNNAITVGADARALHLSAMPVILAPTHPPIAVPWSEIVAVRRARRWFGELYEVQTRALPDLRWGLRRRAFEKVRASAAAAGVTLVEE